MGRAVQRTKAIHHAMTLSARLSYRQCDTHTVQTFIQYVSDSCFSEPHCILIAIFNDT